MSFGVRNAIQNNNLIRSVDEPIPTGVRNQEVTETAINVLSPLGLILIASGVICAFAASQIVPAIALLVGGVAALILGFVFTVFTGRVEYIPIPPPATKTTLTTNAASTPVLSSTTNTAALTLPTATANTLSIPVPPPVTNTAALTPPPETTSVTNKVPRTQEQAVDLVNLYNALNEPSKPSFQGSILEQAEKIGEWMKTSAFVQACFALVLKGKQLLRLPPEIGLFRKLETLWLRDNFLEELPPEIRNLTLLKSLDVAQNQIKKLCAAIGELKCLTSIHAENNQINELCFETSNLQVLGYLNLSNNKLEAIPTAIQNLPHGVTLLFAKNQLTALPEFLFDFQSYAIDENPYPEGYLKSYSLRLQARP